ncbi:MAG TPA: hypothetical protein VII06_08900 [Chloroflexota bacterium]|jgi:hypothetical protein
MGSSRLFGAIVLVGGLAALALLGHALSPGRALAALAAAGEPWPPFVMVYREPVGATGTNGPPPSFQKTRVEYRDRQHWRIIQLKQARTGDVEGTTYTFNTDTLTIHEPSMASSGPDRSGVYPPGQAPTRPPWGLPRWVAPTLVELQVGKPGHVIKRLGDGLAVLRRTGLCVGYLVRTETTFRMDDGIPLRQVRTVNGVPTTTYEVLELATGAAALEWMQAAE